MVLNSILHAENRLGRPVFIRDVLDSMKTKYYFAIMGMLVWLMIQDIYRNDELLSDNELSIYSVRPEMQDSPSNPTGFELYSDRIKRIYASYELDQRLRIIPGPETKTVNFNQLKEILISKDLARNE